MARDIAKGLLVAVMNRQDCLLHNEMARDIGKSLFVVGWLVAMGWNAPALDAAGEAAPASASAKLEPGATNQLSVRRSQTAATEETAKPGTGDTNQLWSIRPLGAMVPPAPKSGARVKGPIDAFLLAKLEEKGLTAAPPASRLTLLRRAYFDLIGLAPSPEEIQSFCRDKRPEAYEELIERLLASPRYGERWGRHWLDVVRYADTGGSETDLPYENSWKYRDYVIRSLNADKPFDRFIQEQIAGDELWPEDAEAVTATALYAIGPVLEESAMVSDQLEYEWLTDAADTTGAAFLGLTVGCARCHNHKYDPIPQKDYFALQAVFAGSDRVYPEVIRERRIKALHGLLAEKPLPEELKNDPNCKLKTEKDDGLRLVHRDTPMEVRLLRRGELSKPGDVVGPGLLTALTTGKRGADLCGVPATQRRAALARWLTQPEENPLVARVLVNRVWAWHFGQGIVRTPNDFGTQGDPPTHPELLDWLARDFIEHGWSLKHLHRVIMSSSAYQQASVAPDLSNSALKPKAHNLKAKIGQSLPALAATKASQADPENRLLWHFPRQRLEAEAIWDNLHACGGTLNLEMFGPPVVPPLTDEELAGLFNAKGKWMVSKEPSEHRRRGVYLLVRRTFLFPMFDAFDPPELMTSCPRRLETIVPAQALTLLNSKVVVDQSRAFADRLLTECDNEPKKLLARAWLLAFNRPITKAETAQALAFLGQRQAALSRVAERPSASAPLEEALRELCVALFNANEFTYID